MFTLKVFDQLSQYLDIKIKSFTDEKILAGNAKLFACIHTIEKMSSRIITWTLSITGGSFLAILSNEYIHPDAKAFKIAYLLFVLGWTFFGISIANGINITGSASASDLYKENSEQITNIFLKCNKYLRRQLLFFKIALVIFGIWLILYLCWWVFGDIPIKK